MAITSQERERLKLVEDLRLDAEDREKSLLRVLVVGGGFLYIKMFHDAGFLGATGVEDADIVCFTGGSDVNPALYKEEALPCTGFDERRDEYEADIFGQCLALRKPMVGICRGGQFLNVMNGGKMWQDVNNHAGTDHPVTVLKTGKVIQGMTSTHHQMMIPASGGEIIALASMSTRKTSFGTEVTLEKPQLADVEVVWYNDSLCLCFQPHPEFMVNNCRKFFLDLVDEYVIPAC